jgi:hypothetical protein
MLVPMLRRGPVRLDFLLSDRRFDTYQVAIEELADNRMIKP